MRVSAPLAALPPAHQVAGLPSHCPPLALPRPSTAPPLPCPVLPLPPLLLPYHRRLPYDLNVVGFSAVLFGLKVVLNQSGEGWSNIIGIPGGAHQKWAGGCGGAGLPPLRSALMSPGSGGVPSSRLPPSPSYSAREVPQPKSVPPSHLPSAPPPRPPPPPSTCQVPVLGGADRGLHVQPQGLVPRPPDWDCGGIRTYQGGWAEGAAIFLLVGGAGGRALQAGSGGNSFRSKPIWSKQCCCFIRILMPPSRPPPPSSF